VSREQTGNHGELGVGKQVSSMFISGVAMLKDWAAGLVVGNITENEGEPCLKPSKIKAGAASRSSMLDTISARGISNKWKTVNWPYVATVPLKFLSLANLSTSEKQKMSLYRD